MAHRHRSSALAIVWAGAIACAGGPPRTSTPARAPSPVVSTAGQRLLSFAVADDDYYRRVLYTWTTPEQIADLRTSRQLLVATATSGPFTSPFNRALATIAARRGRGQAIARLLAMHPSLNRRRYAWPAPFATVMGLSRRTYGNALIRIELRPEAWIGRFDPGADEPFTFVDAAGRSVPVASVLAAPERIAAIFHVRVEPSRSIRFREYVVCSAAMVASWSVATPEIRAEIDAESDLLRALRGPFAELPHDERHGLAARAWAHRPDDSRPIVRWRAALAFDSPRYRPDPDRLDAILSALAAYDGSGPALEVEAQP